MELLRGILPWEGVGGILYTFESNYWKFNVGFGRRTNNTIEILELKLVLMLAIEKRIQKLQVMGDSKFIIDWIKGITTMRNFQLRLIFNDIINTKNSINEVTFLHAYIERKTNVDL